LGIKAIYFNPIFEAESMHKYDGTSFHHVDDNFGPDPDRDKKKLREAGETDDPMTWIWTSADSLFLRLIKEAHTRNIRIVIDGVFNHTGTQFFAFQDLRRNQIRSKYADWYDVKTWDNPATAEDEFEYKGWWDVKTLPEFKEDNNGLTNGVKNYIFNISQRWMDPNGDGDPTDGIDGWRLDAADEVSDVFWAEWFAHIKSINPSAILVAENWKISSDWIKNGLFDGVMNYPFAYSMLDFFINKKKAITALALKERLDDLIKDYGQENMHFLWNLVESHDTERIASAVKNPDRRGFDRDGSLRDNVEYDMSKPDDAARSIHQLIAVFQLMFNGSPLIFYGTEAGMWGADDPDNRKPMLWADLDYAKEVSHPVPGKNRSADDNIFDKEFFEFYKRLIKLRHNTPAISYGNYKPVVDTLSADTFGFLREFEDQAVLCLFNRSEKPFSHSLPKDSLRFKRFNNALTEKISDLSKTNFSLNLPARSYLILVSE
jgi:glycosidase